MLMKSLIICTALAVAITANAQTPPAPKNAEEARALMQAQQEAYAKKRQEAQAQAQAQAMAAKEKAAADAKAAQEQAVADAAAAAALTKWLLGTEGAQGIVVGQSGGKDLTICRMAMPNKEVHSGKAWNNTCYVGFGGKELNMPLDKGEVLSLPEPVWVNVVRGQIPSKAVVNGTSGGAPMHIC